MLFNTICYKIGKVALVCRERVRRAPRRDVLDLLPPPDVTVWTGEGWTEQDGSRFRHPSTQGLLRREAGE